MIWMIQRSKIERAKARIENINRMDPHPDEYAICAAQIARPLRGACAEDLIRLPATVPQVQAIVEERLCATVQWYDN